MSTNGPYLSPDGLWMWNGTGWVPNPAAAPPGYVAPPATATAPRPAPAADGAAATRAQPGPSAASAPPPVSAPASPGVAPHPAPVAPPNPAPVAASPVPPAPAAPGAAGLGPAPPRAPIPTAPSPPSGAPTVSVPTWTPSPLNVPQQDRRVPFPGEETDPAVATPPAPLLSMPAPPDPATIPLRSTPLPAAEPAYSIGGPIEPASPPIAAGVPGPPGAPPGSGPPGAIAPPRSSNTPIVLAIAGTMVVMGGLFVAFLLASSPKPATATHTVGQGLPGIPGVSAGASPIASQGPPGATAYTDPYQLFTATFDGKPSYTSQSVSTKAGTFPLDIALYERTQTSGQMVGVIPIPAGTAFDLNLGVNGMAQGSGGHVVSSTPTTFQGHPAVQAVILAQGVYLELMVVSTPTDAYIIGTLAPTNPPADYAAFLASAHLTPH